MRMEALSHTFVKEFQNFKHYMKEEEGFAVEKFQMWKEHAQHFPERLAERIRNFTQLLKSNMT